MTTLHLTEYQAIQLPSDTLSHELGLFIHTHYGRYIDVVFPSPRTNGRWQLTAQGWIGHLPLPNGGQLTIHTKVAVANLWQLLGYAYSWHTWQLLDGLVYADTLPAFYDGLARALAEKCLYLARRGLFGSYQPKRSRQTTVRGRIQIAQTLQKPIEAGLVCDFSPYSHDNLHNQILALTLDLVGRSGWCTPQTGQWVRRARQALPVTTPVDQAVIDWQALTYSRLNDAYRPLHALCRFFLDGLLPNQQFGTQTAVPFLINMSLLYEQFVAAWLEMHLPAGYRARAQERVTLDGTKGRQIAIDLVLYDQSGRATAVLDTKYKAPERPDMGDIYQVTFYAHQQQCLAAYLVYPIDLVQPVHGTNNGVTYRNLTFSLDGDVDENGRVLIEALLHG